MAKEHLDNPTIVSQNCVVEGNIEGKGECQIEGKIKGNVNFNSLIIGSHASLEGNVKADTVYVSGKVCGNISCQTIELISTADVKGDIYHNRISIEEGAKIDGACKPLAENEKK